MADMIPLAVKMTATAEGVQKGVNDTKKIISQGANDLAKQAESLGKTMGSRLTSAFKGAMVAGAAGGAIVAAGSIYAYVEGANAIREMGNAAAQASAPVAEFQAVAAAFGKNEDAIDGITKLNALLGKAAVLGEGADALEKIGLDANKLLASGNAFEQVADKIAGMGGGFRASWAAMSLFGEDYKKFMPVLSRGGEFIREQRELLASFGATINGSAVGNVRDADRFFAQFQALKDGFFIQVASGVSPIIAELSNLIPKLADMGITFRGMADRIVDAVEGVSKFAVGIKAAFTDAEIRKELWKMAEEFSIFLGYKLAENIAWAFSKAFTSIGRVSFGSILGKEIAVDFSGLGKSLGESADKARAVANKASVMSNNAWLDMLDLMAGNPLLQQVEGFFGRVRNRMGNVADTARNNNPFEIWKASVDALESSTQSATDGMVKEFERLSNLVKNAPTINDLLSPKGSFARNPIDEFQNAFMETVDQAQAMQDKLLEPVFRKLGGLAAQIGAANQYQPVSAMEQGSREAFSTVTAARLSARESMEQMIARLLAENNRIATEQVKTGRELVEAWRKAQPVRVGGI